jgi:hypothetical protein
LRSLSIGFVTSSRWSSPVARAHAASKIVPIYCGRFHAIEEPHPTMVLCCLD